MRALVVVLSFGILALIQAREGDKCTALTRQDTCGSLSYCCTTTKKVDDCLVPGLVPFLTPPPADERMKQCELLVTL